MNFASTLLVNLKDKLDKITDQSVRNDIETEIRKADLDLLDKINQLSSALATIQASIPSTGNLAPLPQTAAGVGQWYTTQPAPNAAYILPAGGTWLYWICPINTTNGTWGGAGYSVTGGMAAGGTTVGAAGASLQWVGFCWRIA